MTLFQQVLWMTVNIRVLGKEPASPLYGRGLIQYAATLQLQYSRICTPSGNQTSPQGPALRKANRRCGRQAIATGLGQSALH
jgi:hypothetical protein